MFYFNFHPREIFKWNCTNLNINLSIFYTPRVYTRWMEDCKHNPKGWPHVNITCNYCPVSLTSICSKLLEHILYSCIFSHLKEHNILCEEQHGFQAGKSCETQLIMTLNDFANCLNENSQIDWISRKLLIGYHIIDYVKNYPIMELEVFSCYGLSIIF